MMTELSQIISQIEPLNPTWLDQARERLDSLTKPRGSLGRLEELAALYVGIRGELLPALEKKWVVVFAADHGVVAEGVSAYPQEVTYQMVLNFLRGGAGINALARMPGPGWRWWISGSTTTSATSPNSSTGKWPTAPAIWPRNRLSPGRRPFRPSWWGWKWRNKPPPPG